MSNFSCVKKGHPCSGFFTECWGKKISSLAGKTPRRAGKFEKEGVGSRTYHYRQTCPLSRPPSHLIPPPPCPILPPLLLYLIWQAWQEPAVALGTDTKWPPTESWAHRGQPFCYSVKWLPLLPHAHSGNHRHKEQPVLPHFSERSCHFRRLSPF